LKGFGSVLDMKNLPSGALLVVPSKTGSNLHWEGKWVVQGRQKKKRLGLAWVEARATPLDGADEGWQEKYKKRKGRPDEGYLTHSQALAQMAIEIAASFEAHRQAGVAAQFVTFEQAADGWVQYGIAVLGWKKTTQRDYAYLLRMPGTAPKPRGRPPSARLMTAFAGHEISSITKAQINEFLTGLDNDESLSARSVNAYRQVLSGIFRFAADSGWIADNPVVEIKKRREEDPAEVMTYTPAQLQTLIEKAPTEMFVSLLTTAALTGLRQGELLELRWRDIDFETRKIHVQRSISSGLEITSTKSRMGRTVPLVKQLEPVLFSTRERDFFTSQKDLVFTDTGSNLDARNVRRKYYAARAKACAEDPDMPADLTFHGLRRYFASQAAAGGLDVVSIQKMMGHVSIKTTQRYMHAQPGADDAERLSRAFANDGES
jgi:integrase